MANIVIIGAGLTGLSTAYHLEKRGFFDYVMYEKDATIGGLCRSVTQDGFTFDYTGHLLHASDHYFRSLISDIVGMEHLNTITRRSFIYSQNTYSRYPYQINLHGLPTQTIAECLEGFILRTKSRRKPHSFYDWVLKNFGSGIAKHFFFPFQKKIFSYNLKQISPTWTGRFVPQTSLVQMLNGAIRDNSEEAIGYNPYFFYPKTGGINFWINKLADALLNPIYTGMCIKKINLKNKTITLDNGHTESYKLIINTMPLDELLSILEEPAHLHTKPALNKLVCNSVVNFNLGIARPDVSDKHWIYFPESEYPFYRIGFPHNFSDEMVPSGCSSLYGEFSYIKKNNRYIHNILNQAVQATKKVLTISDKDIITQKNIFIKHAYVIYDFWREKHIPGLLSRLQENNIYSVGRYGEWKYSSMQEAVLDGKKIAETVTIMPAKQSFYTPHMSNMPTKRQEA